MNRYRRSLIVLFFCVKLIACVTHSPLDPRTFYCETLDNGLRVLLIEDPSAEESAAAMSVAVGSQDDPDDYLGLAHFLEHMLFIATEDYPEVDALSHFVSNKGGQYNAYTAFDHTQYYFSVPPEAFLAGFDIFSSFFIAPSFPLDYVERERHAVDAEFNMGKSNDDRRIMTVRNLSAHSTHPANRFTVGNLETLKDQEGGRLIDVLKAFYHTHYSADKMNFVAISKDPIDRIKASIIPRLKQIRKKEGSGVASVHRLAEEDLGVGLVVETKAHKNELTLLFQVPARHLRPRSVAMPYLSSLLGDESLGSVLSVLKAKGYAQALSVGSLSAGARDDFFVVHIALTDIGKRHQDETVNLVFQYLKCIQKEGITLERFHSLQRISYLKYLYYQPVSPSHLVQQYANQMRYVPTDRLITDAYLLEDKVFSKSDILEFLAYLTPSNMQLIYADRDVATTSVEPIYNINYHKAPIDTTSMDYYLSETPHQLSLPKPNPYIPEDLSLKPLGSGELQEKNNHYILQDVTFRLPIQYLAAILKTKPIEDIKAIVMQQLLVRLLYEQSEASLYPAIEAGLGFDIQVLSQHLVLQAYGKGRPDRLRYALIQSLEKLFSQDFKSTFEQVKATYLEQFDQYRTALPIKLLFHYLQVMLNDDSYPYQDLLVCLQSIQYEDFLLFLNDFYKQVSVVTLSYGNVATDDDVEKELGFQTIQLVDDFKLSQVSKTVLPEKTRVNQINAHHDQAVLFYVMMDTEDELEMLKARLLSRMLSASFFESLRTEQQLGYLVGLGYYENKQHPGIILYVQSPKAAVARIESSIKEFMQQTSYVSESSFIAAKSSLIHDYEKRYTRMDQVFSDLLQNVLDNEIDLKRRERLATLLKSIEYDDLVAFHQHYFIEKEPVYLTVDHSEEVTDIKNINSKD